MDRIWLVVTTGAGICIGLACGWYLGRASVPQRSPCPPPAPPCAACPAPTVVNVANLPMFRPREVLGAVSASALCDAYAANEVGADAKYEGKRATVTGAVRQVADHFGNGAEVYLECAPGRTLYALVSRDNQGPVGKLARGDVVSLDCVLRGRDIGGTVTADECVLINAAPRGP